VVEDAIAVRNMLEDFLSLYGYDVLVASHPDTAFRRLKQSSASLDAMILDIGLDDNRSGIEVLELMRLDDRFVSLPVVVLTGHALPEHAQAAREAGCDLVITKPCLPDQLMEAIRRILDAPKARPKSGR
jgi:DNA-binding response OmpR family regulator